LFEDLRFFTVRIRLRYMRDFYAFCDDGPDRSGGTSEKSAMFRTILAAAPRKEERTPKNFREIGCLMRPPPLPLKQHFLYRIDIQRHGDSSRDR
jgi:hypothetical protein